MLTIHKREVAPVAVCPVCSREGRRQSVGTKKIREIGSTIVLKYSKHFCVRCEKHFTNPAVSKYSPVGRRFSWVFMWKAIELGEKLTLKVACSKMKEKSGHRLPETTLHDWIHEKEHLFVYMPLGLVSTTKEKEE